MKWTKDLEPNWKKRLRKHLNLFRPFQYMLIRWLWRNRVMSTADTIKKLQDGASIARFGDGEYQLALYEECGWCPFQKNSPRLQQRLMEILKSDPIPGLLIGVVGMTRPARNDKVNKVDFNMHIDFLQRRFAYLFPLLMRRRDWGNAMITRPYGMGGVPLGEYKKIWNNRNVVFITGVKGRLEFDDPVVFGNLKSAQVLEIPHEHAFEKYDEILTAARKYPKDTLFLIAAGPTATVLAYDLHFAGYQAIDIGHITASLRTIHGDIEYPEAFNK